MSSLFNDAMRAAVFCDASGLMPETPEQIAARREYARQYAESRQGFCLSSQDFYEDDISCDLAVDHEGDHIHRDAFDNLSFEVRWPQTPA